MTPNPSGAYRLGYRGDIEGLRAIAILLVVACHAKFPWFAGGFIGVDVFYVLSGYLITGLLVQELRTSGDLRFANFYARRLRRLMPALLLMVAVTSVLARLLLAASSQPGQATAAASAALWVSNFHFAFSNMGYFAPGAETNLFLHTWSLGVEEQFYLVWPLLVVLGMGAWYGAKKAPSSARLKWYFAVVGILSFALSFYWTHTSPHLAFYMMPSRAWQFALGALTFLLVGSPAARPEGTTPRPRWLLPLAGWLGLAMIVLASVLIDGSMPYPGTWALLPSIGAVLVLAAGADGSAHGVARVLTVKPMQAIGRVSYSWYLWHWPVLLLGATLLDVGSVGNRLALITISFLLALLSYHFFETPIRHNRWILKKPRIGVLAALLVMGAAGTLAWHWNSTARARMQRPDQARYATVQYDSPIIYRMGCDQWYHSADVKVCTFGDKDAKHVAVAMGDSIALQWFPAYKQIFDKPGWQLRVITKSACPMVDVPIFYARFGREYTECAQWRHAAVQKIAALKPDVVVFGSTYTYDYTKTQWIDGTRDVLSALTPNVGNIYVMRSSPTLPFDGPSCLAPRSWLYQALRTKSQCTAPAYSAHSASVYHWLQTAAAPFNNVQLIDMTSSICPEGVCHAELNGQIVFRDNEHMRASFARSLAPALEHALSSAAAGAP